jgi:uncharacterized protein (DUF58 family)
MISPELIKKIRQIQIRTSHTVDDLLGGQYHSAFKGRGIEFEEVRPYQFGDDVRTIDWNVTARSGEPYVKLFREERELTVHLLVDLSASQSFGTQRQLKRELVTELGALLAFAAIRNSDKIGLLLFTDQVEKIVPPGKGTRHVLRVIRELLHCSPIGRGTNLKRALEHFHKTTHRRSVAFLISDFQDEGYGTALRIASRRHAVIPVVVSDRREFEVPNVGLVRLRDAESGRIVTLDTSGRRQREKYSQLARAGAARREKLFERLGLDSISLETGGDLVAPLRRFFHRREVRR